MVVSYRLYFYFYFLLGRDLGCGLGLKLTCLDGAGLGPIKKFFYYMSRVWIMGQAYGASSGIKNPDLNLTHFHFYLGLLQVFHNIP